MKSATAIIVFFTLMLPALFLGYNNYAAAREGIIEDVNQALAKTVLYENSDRITADTLRVFRSHLRISRLKETCYLSLCTQEPSRVSFCSDTLSYKSGDERLYIRAYPNCSQATIFSLSGQTIPGALCVSGILWGLFSAVYLHGKERTARSGGPAGSAIAFGGLSFSPSSGRFYNERKEEITFTPMQSSFMSMLMASEEKRVSADEICRNLWPGKDNAKESMYTLVRRLKPIVRANSRVQIVADKGGYYALRAKTHD